MSEGAASPLRVLLVASAGGHWIELSRLSPAFAGAECQFACTTSGLRAPVGDREVLVIADGSRDRVNGLFSTARRMWGIINQFRPDVVLSTGSAPGAVALVIARLRGLRTVWVESVTCRDELSLSGTWVRPFASLFLVQWPQLLSRHPRARYFGQVL